MSQKNPLSRDRSSIYATSTDTILHQAVNLIKRIVSFDISIAPDEMSFRSVVDENARYSGLQGVVGRLDESVLSVKLQVLNVSTLCRIEPEILFDHLSELGERTRIAEPEDTGASTTSLWIEMKLGAAPMSISRSAVFLEEIKKIDALARSLQKSVPEIADEDELAHIYTGVEDVLDPVIPVRPELLQASGEMSEWTADTAGYLEGLLPVAISASDELMGDYAIACLARHLMTSGLSLGLLHLPAINSAGVVDLAGKAPGIVVVPVERLQIGSNVYEIGNETSSMLSALKTAGRSVVFTGAHHHLQEAFHGGQGGRSDPLRPVVRHVPEQPIEHLIRHAIETRSRQIGGLSEERKSELVADVATALSNSSVSQPFRLIRPMVNRQMTQSGQRTGDPKSAKSYAATLSEVRETLCGVSVGDRTERPRQVQQRFTDVIVESDLLSMFKKELLAQDSALEELVLRLRTECLTRPLHQPIRYCAQGTPATGKSRSAAMLAEYLRVPFVNIDAASIPSFYTASAQLLGSGRGIVGSHRSGRLEQAAKHHSGAVVEISDLDHASEEVRAALADLFLQVLETGQAQSATGVMFSCASLIFAFTINLPGGMDETVRKSFGFEMAPSKADVRKKVVGEIKTLFSTAFLSRIGAPILFEPLNGPAIEKIIVRTLEDSIRSVMERLMFESSHVVIGEGVAESIASGVGSGRATLGARVLIEHSRQMVAKSLPALRACCLKAGDTLLVEWDGSGTLNFHKE
jgi:hypothetical protein